METDTHKIETVDDKGKKKEKLMKWNHLPEMKNMVVKHIVDHLNENFELVQVIQISLVWRLLIGPDYCDQWLV